MPKLLFRRLGATDNLILSENCEASAAVEKKEFLMQQRKIAFGSIALLAVALSCAYVLELLTPKPAAAASSTDPVPPERRAALGARRITELVRMEVQVYELDIPVVESDLYSPSLK
jgi:hypothetical protein